LNPSEKSVRPWNYLIQREGLKPRSKIDIGKKKTGGGGTVSSPDASCEIPDPALVGDAEMRRRMTDENADRCEWGCKIPPG
jgi:hypothetical protein